jgi:large subunit ribosomal protein L25
MAQVTALAAEEREGAGTGAARQTRRAGRVPCVIYGNKEDSVLISIDPLDLMLQLRGPGFFARVFEIEIGGKKHKVLARDLQVDPVSDRPIHVDFMRFSATTRLNVDVEIMFENEDESPGLKRGGVLNVVRHTIELVCRADSIPEVIEFDLTGTDIGDSIHISAVTLPDGVSPAIADRDFTVATVASPTVVRDEAAEEAEDEELEGVEGVEGVEGEEGEAKPEGEGESGSEGAAPAEKGRKD